MNIIFDQLARSGLLFDDEVVASILGGNLPPLEKIVLELLISCMDADVTVRNDATSSWNEKRIVRACLAIAFLTAIACTTTKTGQ
jgi:hypothetical protein